MFIVFGEDGLLNGSEVISKMVPFNSITGSMVTQTFTEGSLPKIWAQYLIRPYYNFYSKDCSSGLYFSQWDSTTQLNVFNPKTIFSLGILLDFIAECNLSKLLLLT